MVSLTELQEVPPGCMHLFVNSCTWIDLDTFVRDFIRSWLIVNG
jgi:hypothetical protein